MKDRKPDEIEFRARDVAFDLFHVLLRLEDFVGNLADFETANEGARIAIPGFDEVCACFVIT